VSDGAPDAPLDLRELFAALVGHGVEFVVIGGVAVQVHGHRRTTKDLDVIPAPGPENLGRLAAALRALDARPAGMPGGNPPTLEQLATAPVVPPLITRHGELHVLNAVPGAAAYGDLARRSLRVPLGDIELNIAGLDDLISMKRASGREADLADLAVLTRPRGE
jgi:hypothetical protein